MSIMYNNKCIAGSYEDSANTDLSNLTDRGSKMMDGQWVSKTATLSTATAVGTYTIDLSSYLPNDNYNYEVLCSMLISRKDTSLINSQMYLFNKKPDLSQAPYPNQVGVLNIDSRGVKDTFSGEGTTIFSVTDKKFWMVLSFTDTTVSIHSARLVIYAYRRIGTNY